MNTGLSSTIFRLTRLAAPLCLFVLALGLPPAQGQELSGGNLRSVSYSYILEPGGERQYFDLGVLSETDAFQDLSIEALGSILAETPDDLRLLAENTIVQALDADFTTQPLAAGIQLGGVHSAAAFQIMGVTIIGKIKCALIGKKLIGVPILGSSSMRAVQYAVDANDGTGLGRGQFNIRTTKFVLCRDPDKPVYEGVPINVRWVFNVNNDSLTTEKGSFSDPPPGNGTYKQRFLARGEGIQLVLLQVDDFTFPPNSPVYLKSADACIDIWFVDPVDDFDIWVPASTIGNGVFCAGGYCKNKPPGLDATQ